MTAGTAVIPGAQQPLPEDAPLERRLPSGRSLHLRTGGAGEEIELRSPKGELELKIVLTDAGPLVTLRCARLDVESPDVSFRCDTFDLQTKGDLRLQSGGQLAIQASELRAQTTEDIHLNGAYIRLNCDPDLVVPVVIPGLPPRTETASPAADGCAGHDHGKDPIAH